MFVSGLFSFSSKISIIFFKDVSVFSQVLRLPAAVFLSLSFTLENAKQNLWDMYSIKCFSISNVEIEEIWRPEHGSLLTLCYGRQVALCNGCLELMSLRCDIIKLCTYNCRLEYYWVVSQHLRIGKSDAFHLPFLELSGLMEIKRYIPSSAFSNNTV